MKATSTIPIVFNTGFDPIKAGLVSSLSRPGGNVTGVSRLSGEIEAKRLEFLHELVPNARVVGFMLNPENPGTETHGAMAAAAKLGLQLHILKATSLPEIEKAFDSLRTLGAGALLISGETLFNAHVRQIAALAMKHAMPTIYTLPEFAAGGGLASYGADRKDGYRVAGMYVGRILKGEKPQDLPVLQPTKFELAINLRAAKALGLTIPPMWLARADEVIE